jgi:hypothetical protein
MRRLPILALAVSVATPAAAQQLARRVASVGSGQAHFSYAARPDVCGDGRTVILRWLESQSEMFMVSYEGGTISGSFDMRNQVCNHGPVRVQLTVLAGRVRTLWPAVGGSGGGRGRDLGTVGTQEAADYLLQLARTASEDLSSHALLAAALADSVRISPRLIDMAEDRRLEPMNREQALKWVGRTAPRDGDTGADARVRAIAADETEHVDVRERAIRVVTQPAGDAFLRDLYGRLTLAQLKERVIRELGESPNDANLDWIERIARNPKENSELRERAIRVLGEDRHETQRLRSLYSALSQIELKERVIRVVGETGDADAIEWLKSVAVDRSEPQEARERALRVLGEQTETPYLRQVYDRLDNTELQERVLRALGEAGGAENLRFVRRVALDSSAVTDLRDRALKVLSEAGVPTTDLVVLYDAIRDPDLRDRLIKLLAERGDRDARTKLADIAANDPDPDLRERARRERSN